LSLKFEGVGACGLGENLAGKDVVVVKAFESMSEYAGACSSHNVKQECRTLMKYCGMGEMSLVVRDPTDTPAINWLGRSETQEGGRRYGLRDLGLEGLRALEVWGA
jgi:hypothetical protein